MRKCRIGAHAKYDLRVRPVRISKYRKPVLDAPVTAVVRELIRQIAMEREVQIISRKFAIEQDHFLLACRPNQDSSSFVRWPNDITSLVPLQEFAHPRKQFWDRLAWAWGYLAVSRGAITEAMADQSIAEQERKSDPDDGRFLIDEPSNLSRHDPNQRGEIPKKFDRF